MTRRGLPQRTCHHNLLDLGGRKNGVQDFRLRRPCLQLRVSNCRLPKHLVVLQGIEGASASQLTGVFVLSGRNESSRVGLAKQG